MVESFLHRSYILVTMNENLTSVLFPIIKTAFINCTQ